MKRKHLIVALLSMFALASGGALAQTQNIDPDPTTQNVAGGAAATINVIYTTANPADETLPGIGVRIHWDSSKLNFVNTTNRLAAGFLSEDTSCQPDTGNFDADPDTDCFVNTAWADFGGNWPGVGNTPTTLYSANFTTILGFGSTTVNFSASSAAAGRAFQSASARITEDITAPEITLTPTTLNFPYQSVGTTSQPRTVTLTNTGGMPLSIISATIDGDFAQTNNCDAILAAGDNCVISVTFTPTAGGKRAGTLTVTSNAASSPDTVMLSGIGGTQAQIPTLSEWAMLLLAMGLISIVALSGRFGIR